MSISIRCPWAVRSGMEAEYHDKEWGVPRYDDIGQFEFLTLEAAQSGLAWLTILRKRKGYHQAFAGFSPEKVARYSNEDVSRLMTDSGIVRNRKKIESAVNNARCFMEVAARHGSFSNYIWSFVDGKPVVNHRQRMEEVPPLTLLSITIAKELKALGFKYLGPTVIYAHMQATGLVNDHLVSCSRHEECCKLAEKAA